jgi:Methyltransferase domain
MNILHQFTNYDDPNSFGSRMRRRRGVMLRALIEQCFAAKGAVRLLDMGGEIAYWNIFSTEYLMAHRVSITLVNLSEENLQHNPNPTLFTNVIGDCCELTFDDGSFDIAHSNSVIEHLGSWEKMSKFAAETRRLARHYYVQTPAFWFPIEPHFGIPIFHWLPEPTRVSLVRRRAIGKGLRAENLDAAMALINYYRLLDKAQFTHLFSDAKLVQEKFLGLTKSFLSIR